MPKRVIITADDFGLSEAVNEAVERAHRDGVLTSASLMVGAPAAGDAVRRARALPSLRVGLHLVVIEGPAVLPWAEIPGLLRSGAPLPQPSVCSSQPEPTRGGSFPSPPPLVGGGREEGSLRAQVKFPSDQLALGLRYAFHPPVRRQLAAEIRAQFAAFAATGLPLDHANAHKHMHLHPTVGRLMIEIGREYGLQALRVPAEPPHVLAKCGRRARPGEYALHRWTALLRRRAQRSGMAVNDHAFGIAWSGHMTTEKLLRLAAHLPDGVNEIYFHPASRRDPVLTALMPDYEHEAELAALLDPAVRAAFAAQGVTMTSFSEVAAPAAR
ncbi:MAG: hopanoid biosynthesis-associated protein HpnK [Alphaproteobacteria bacterium]|nr:hopanoid biosynthesis-associated protein HpnK [Alphaproteobacteria bacterium]